MNCLEQQLLGVWLHEPTQLNVLLCIDCPALALATSPRVASAALHNHARVCDASKTAGALIRAEGELVLTNASKVLIAVVELLRYLRMIAFTAR